jgi:predicted DNA binding CopG/RHH family protein
MSKKVPEMTTDEEAERFLEADLSDLDFSQFKRDQFEFEAKDAQISMRLPRSLLRAVKSQAKARGIPYQRRIREMLENELRRSRDIDK